MAAKSLPQIKIQNTGGAQTNVPFTFGQVFAPGDLAPTDGLIGGTLPLQVDVKATHADGSVRHAILSGVLPKLAAGETVALQFAKAVKSSKPPVTMADVQGLSFGLVVTLDGKKYTAPIQDNGTPWLTGDIVGEWFFNASLKDEAGQPHPNLTACFGVRYYPAAKQARVEFIVENTKTWAPGLKPVYDVELQLNGATVFLRKALEHYHHSRWHQYFWTGAAPQTHIVHDRAYLIASKAVANYDQSVTIPENVLAGMGAAVNDSSTGLMKIGTVQSYMGMTGGRGDIGPLPEWTVNYLLSQDRRAKDLMLANADGSGSWSVHLRDEKTGFPVRTDNDANKLITTHPNAANQGPLPVPRFQSPQDAATPYADDVAHEPSLAYVPYLVTGEHYYLEEMQFWAVWNALGTAPGSNGYGQGLLRWHQIRGQAWALRALAEVAYITPDSDSMKAYFMKQLDNNLSWYSDVYVKGNPNALGIIDGSGEAAAEVGNAMAPWQDDFMTWAFGYMAGLGFDKARPMLEWKSKFPVGRLVGDGYCPTMCTPYQFVNLRAGDGKVVGSFAELYRATFGGDTVPDDLGFFRSFPDKGKFIDLPCGSQAQADFLNALNGNWGWQLGRTNGLADSINGPSANFQPALAAAVDAGVKDADKAWQRFAARPLKPNWSQNPQWNIVPRKFMPAAVPASIPAVPAPPAVQTAAAPGVGTWKKVGGENEKISLPVGSQVRYGAEGKYVYATTLVKEFSATNAVFGSDPAINVVKQVDVFTAAKPASLKTPSNTLLKKLKDLVVKVVDPKTLQIVSKFSGVTASSTGIIAVSGTDMTPKAVYAVVVENAAGKVLDIMFPVTATV